MAKGNGTTRSGSAANPTGVGEGSTLNGAAINSGTLEQAKNTAFTKVSDQQWEVDTPHGGGYIMTNVDVYGNTIYEATPFTYNPNGSTNIIKTEKFAGLNAAKNYIKSKFV